MRQGFKHPAQFGMPHFGLGPQSHGGGGGQPVEIPVQHDSSSSSSSTSFDGRHHAGNRNMQYPQHHHQQQQQQQRGGGYQGEFPDPRAGEERQAHGHGHHPHHGNSSAAPPFHLHHGNKEAFQSQHHGNQGHPWAMHHNHPPQGQGHQGQGHQNQGHQSPHVGGERHQGQAREIPIQHVSTHYHQVPGSQQGRGQNLYPDLRGQGPDQNQNLDARHSSSAHTIPVKRDDLPKARTPPPQKVYSAPPQARPKAASASNSPAPTPPPERTPPPQQQQPPPLKPKTPEERALEIINGVMNEVRELEQTIENYKGTQKHREYKFLEEMLTRSLLKLDSVETDGKDNIRQARKNAVKMIQAALDLLELKAHANEQQTPDEASGASCDPSAEPMDSTNNNQSDNNVEKRDVSAERLDSNVVEDTHEAKPKKNSKPQGHVKEMVLDSEISC